MWATVNVLKSVSKIFDRTKRHHKQLNLFDINIKLAKKCCRTAFRSLFCTLTGRFRNGVLKPEFYVIEVKTYFGMYKVRHIEAIKTIFFSIYSKFYVDFENALRFFENVDAFKGNCIWSKAINFCHLWQECMWAAVNVLKSDPKISNRTKRHQKQLNLFDVNMKFA